MSRFPGTFYSGSRAGASSRLGSLYPEEQDGLSTFQRYQLNRSAAQNPVRAVASAADRTRREAESDEDRAYDRQRQQKFDDLTLEDRATRQQQSRLVRDSLLDYGSIDEADRQAADGDTAAVILRQQQDAIRKGSLLDPFGQHDIAGADYQTVEYLKDQQRQALVDASFRGIAHNDNVMQSRVAGADYQTALALRQAEQLKQQIEADRQREQYEWEMKQMAMRPQYAPIVQTRATPRLTDQMWNAGIQPARSLPGSTAQPNMFFRR